MGTHGRTLLRTDAVEPITHQDCAESLDDTHPPISRGAAHRDRPSNGEHDHDPDEMALDLSIGEGPADVT